MKKHFFRLGSFNIKDGSEIRFREDRWLGNTTLREQYPAMYNIVRHKSDIITTVMKSSPPNVTFMWETCGMECPNRAVGFDPTDARVR